MVMTGRQAVWAGVLLLAALAGWVVAATSCAAEKIVFGPVELPAGTVPVSLAVLEAAKPGNAIGEVLRVTLNTK